VNKKDLTEADIRTKFITPALVASEWDLMTQLREEAYSTKGRVMVRGKTVARGEANKADYLLFYKPKINQNELNALAVPVPPLPAQKRIVAKVDELMALCDRLEAQLQERDTRQAALARAALARFPDAPTPANLELLFHDSFTITPADLRKTILQLAFAGRLISQDPADEPAAVLLEKARAEKARLVAAGLVKKEPWLDDLKAAVELYELPPGWEWTYVSDVVEKVTVGFVGSMKQHYRETGIPFLRSQNVRENGYEPTGLIFISEEFHQSIRKSTLHPGDVVVTRSGNVGVTCVIPARLPEANCSDLVIVKRPLALIPAFLSYFINSIAAGQIDAKTVGIALTHFNTQSVAQLTVALPPLAEQRRIVAKVDQLMALVDQWESQLAASRTTADNLLSALVSELTARPA
jgi:type I restriction enzyme S subunit